MELRREEADGGDDDGSAASEWETVSCLGSEDIRGSVNISTLDLQLKLCTYTPVKGRHIDLPYAYDRGPHTHLKRCHHACLLHIHTACSLPVVMILGCPTPVPHLFPEGLADQQEALDDEDWDYDMSTEQAVSEYMESEDGDNPGADGEPGKSVE